MSYITAHLNLTGIFLRLLNLRKWVQSVVRNVCKYHCTLRNLPEEQRSHLHHGGSLISRKILSVTVNAQVVRNRLTLQRELGSTSI
jgi:hypothetical protein